MGIACGRDHVKMVSLLQPYVDLSVANKMGERPFHVAVRSNAASVVSYLLKSFPHNVLVGPDFLPVWEAVAHGSVDTLLILLKEGKSLRNARSRPVPKQIDLTCCCLWLIDQALMQRRVLTASRPWSLPRGSNTRRWSASSPIICRKPQRNNPVMIFCLSRHASFVECPLMCLSGL